jgi:secreted trypsin-like serine protease
VTYGDDSRRPVLIGVVSAGKKCGTTGRLSQYTRVAKVRDWIERTMKAAR